MTSAITTMAGSEAAEATADVIGIKSLLLTRGVVAGKIGNTTVLPWFGRSVISRSDHPFKTLAKFGDGYL